MLTSLAVLGCGALGFVLYEFLRVYKKRTNGQSVSEVLARDYYLIILVGAVVIGLTSAILSSGDLIEAIYLGFSLPTCASAILGKGNVETSTGVDQEEAKFPQPNGHEALNDSEGGHRDMDVIEEIDEAHNLDFWPKVRNYLYLGN